MADQNQSYCQDYAAGAITRNTRLSSYSCLYNLVKLKLLNQIVQRVGKRTIMSAYLLNNLV